MVTPQFLLCVTGSALPLIFNTFFVVNHRKQAWGVIPASLLLYYLLLSLKLDGMEITASVLEAAGLLLLIQLFQRGNLWRNYVFLMFAYIIDNMVMMVVCAGAHVDMQRLTQMDHLTTLRDSAVFALGCLAGVILSSLILYRAFLLLGQAKTVYFVISIFYILYGILRVLQRNLIFQKTPGFQISVYVSILGMYLTAGILMRLIYSFFQESDIREDERELDREEEKLRDQDTSLFRKDGSSGSLLLDGTLQEVEEKLSEEGVTCNVFASPAGLTGTFQLHYVRIIREMLYVVGDWSRGGTVQFTLKRKGDMLLAKAEAKRPDPADQKKKKKIHTRYLLLSADVRERGGRIRKRKEEKDELSCLITFAVPEEASGSDD